MPYAKKRNAHLHIITTPTLFTGTFDTATNITASMATHEIPGVMDFGYDHDLGVTVRGKGQFGANRPVGMTDEYGGVKGSFDIEGTDGEKAALAYLSKIAVASFVNVPYNRLFEAFLLCNITDDEGNPLETHFVGPARIDAVPKKVGPDAKRFSFQGIYGYDLRGRELRFILLPGDDGSPVTSYSYVGTETPALAFTDYLGNTRYALLVMKYKATTGAIEVLKPATAASDGYYSETNAAITLHSANNLLTADRLLVVYSL